MLHAATGGKIRAPKQALHNTQERKHSAQAQMHKDFASKGNLPAVLLLGSSTSVKGDALVCHRSAPAARGTTDPGRDC